MFGKKGRENSEPREVIIGVGAPADQEPYLNPKLCCIVLDLIFVSPPKFRC